MVEAVCTDNLERQTGYRTLYDAIISAKRHRDGKAIWYCLEIVRPMVMGLVARYIRQAALKRLSSLMAREDLEQVAFEHIIRAIDRFEPPENSPQDDEECKKAWNRYTNMVVRSPMRDAYAQALGPINTPDWALKIASRLNRAVNEHEIEVSEQHLLGGASAPSVNPPDPRIIAAKAGIEYSKVKRYLDNGLHFLPAQRFSSEVESSALAIQEGAEGELSDTSDPAIILTDQQEALMEEAMQLLNSRQQYVISRLYGLDGRPGTHKSVARALEIDPEDVVALERAAISQLKTAFMEDDLA